MASPKGLEVGEEGRDLAHRSVISLADPVHLHSIASCERFANSVYDGGIQEDGSYVVADNPPASEPAGRSVVSSRASRYGVGSLGATPTALRSDRIRSNWYRIPCAHGGNLSYWHSYTSRRHTRHVGSTESGGK